VKHLILISCLISLPLLALRAQDAEALIREAYRLERAMNEKAALAKYTEALRLQPLNAHALSKCSELCSRIGKREPTAGSRNDYYEAAKTYAALALKVNPLDAEANTSMAIALGRISMEKSGKEKVKAARNIRKHVDQALRSDPRNYKAWHVLARWHYEISNLNFIERAAVKVFFGGIPKGSITESIQAFEKARAFSSGFLLNELELARAYHKNKQHTLAMETLRKLLLQPDGTEDDASIKAEARTLLKDWE